MGEGILSGLLISLGLGLMIWRSIVAGRVGRDAHRHGLSICTSARWAVLALVDARRYWWSARLDLLSIDEARDLLQATAQAHRLKSVVNVRCPLCDAEIEKAFAVTEDGTLFIRRQAACKHCDFRLDACRHCEHFLPSTAGATLFDRHGDFSHGRCGFYRAAEPVRTAYPQHARRLEAMGYDMLPAPKPIADAYIPLEECTAFTLRREQLRNNGISWLGRDRVALIRLYQSITSKR